MDHEELLSHHDIDVNRIIHSLNEEFFKKVIAGIADQMIKPGVTQGIQKSIHFLTSTLSGIYMRKTLNNLHSTRFGIRENVQICEIGTIHRIVFCKSLQRERRKMRILSGSIIGDDSEMITLKNVDLNSRVQNAGNIPLREILQVSEP